MMLADLTVILPEIVLAVVAMGALLWAAWRGKDAETPMLIWLGAILMAALAAWIALAPAGTRTAFQGAFVDDGFARFAKVVILLSAALVLLMSQDFLLRRNMARFEYPVLVLLAVTGMMLMVSAGDLLALYMGLELQSLALYVIAAMRRDSLRSTEAGLKYFVLGALSSGLLLYGASLVYGTTGTTAFEGIAAVATGAQDGMPLGLLVGLVFLLTGLAFKISAVPFHMWTPDVYEGAPTPVTAFFATAPKMAAMGLIARVLFDAFGGAVGDWTQIVAILALLSMFLGAFAAIGQTDIKRLMAYSSIGHMGFALLGLVAGDAAGLQATLLYMAIYVTMNIGVFAFILNMEQGGEPVTGIESLSMYSTVEPLRAAALAVLMFSLAGIPPLVGFFAKFYVLKAAVVSGWAWLAVAGVIASVIGAYYYLRIVYLMYFGSPAEPLDGRMPAVHWAALMGAAFVMLAGMINLFGIDALAGAAAASLLP